MFYHIQNRSLSIALLLILTLSYLHGDDNYTAGCEVEKHCFSCHPVCGKEFLSVGLLYWRAFEGGLSGVCDSTETTDTIVDGVLISSLNAIGHDPDFKWDLGFKIGAGYEFAESCCDIGVYWTHYSSHNGNGINDENKHQWNIDFNVVDILYSCECDCSTCFTLNPFVGLKFANIQQTLHTHFISTANELLTTSVGDSKENFWGVGPLIGAEGNWEVGSGFSLYANISGAILFGAFDVRSNQSENFITRININNTRKSSQACQPILGAGFGLRWKTCICNERLLVVQLGFENHSYFNHNQFCGYGDLNLGGATLALGVEF